MTNHQVGEWVHSRRSTLKLSVKRCADLAEISRQTVYDIESGKHPPSVETQRGLARALRVGRDWYERLLAGDEPTEITIDADNADVWAVVRELQERLDALEARRASPPGDTPTPVGGSRRPPRR